MERADSRRIMGQSPHPYMPRGLIALGLIALTLATFWPVHSCGFINYDDDLYVTENRMVQAARSDAGGHGLGVQVRRGSHR